MGPVGRSCSGETRRGRRRVLAALGAGALAGCGAPAITTESPTRRATAGSPVTAPDRRFGYTHLRPDGNRVAEGEGHIPDVTPIEASVPFEPAWIVAVPLEEGSLWAVVGREGRTAGFRLRDGALEPTRMSPGSLPSGMPPLLRVGPDGARLVTPPIADASPLTHPLPVAGGWAILDRDGAVVLWDGDVRRRLAVGAPPDARLRRVGRGRLAVLADATTRYDHGALGDGIEAGGIAVLDTTDDLALLRTLPAAGDAVIEGLAPIAADLTGDGRKELLVTVTDARRGARVTAYDPGGGRVAAGPAIGTGFRWRHGIAVAPFAPDGSPELAAVRTPHIGGVVEFYRHGGDGLSIVATLSGYSSHGYGSRTLDGGLAADADGDGRVELVVPTGPRDALAGIRRTAEGATEAWRVPVGGDLATNLLGVEHGGGLAIGVGRRDGRVLVWA